MPDYLLNLINPTGGVIFMLRFKDLRKLRRTEQNLHGRSWWALHALGTAGLLAAGFFLGKKRR